MKIPVRPIKPEKIDLGGNYHLIGIAIIFMATKWIILAILLGYL